MVLVSLRNQAMILRKGLCASLLTDRAEKKWWQDNDSSPQTVACEGAGPALRILHHFNRLLVLETEFEAAKHCTFFLVLVLLAASLSLPSTVALPGEQTNAYPEKLKQQQKVFSHPLNKMCVLLLFVAVTLRWSCRGFQHGEHQEPFITQYHTQQTGIALAHSFLPLSPTLLGWI